MIVRTVDKLCRVVLPHEMREMCNILPGDKVWIYLKDDCIVVRSCYLSCVFCGFDGGRLNLLHRKSYCTRCAAELRIEL